MSQVTLVQQQIAEQLAQNRKEIEKFIDEISLADKTKIKAEYRKMAMDEPGKVFVEVTARTTEEFQKKLMENIRSEIQASIASWEEFENLRQQEIRKNWLKELDEIAAQWSWWKPELIWEI
jgi:hypothetical protein